MDQQKDRCIAGRILSHNFTHKYPNPIFFRDKEILTHDIGRPGVSKTGGKY